MDRLTSKNICAAQIGLHELKEKGNKVVWVRTGVWIGENLKQDEYD